MTLANPSFEAWRNRAQDADIIDVALRKPVSAQLKKHSREWVGPCPACGGQDRFAVNPGKGVFNCRGSEGGGVITMVMHVCAVGFLAACEIINGEPPPAGESRVSEAELEQQERQREADRKLKQKQRDEENDRYREKERAAAFRIWEQGVPPAGTATEAYLAKRGLVLPSGTRVRAMPQLAYWLTEGRGSQPEMLHSGPAMLLPIIRGGKFAGVHQTYIDLDQPKGKLLLAHPESGKPLDVKKVRGSQQGCHIEVVPCADPKRMIVGEGYEKVAAVWLALHETGAEIASTAFWTSINLGNLGGAHLRTVRHPTRKTDKGRPLTVAGPEPDLSDPGIEIPDSVDQIVILGDRSSDEFLTRCTIARSAKRWEREGRAIRVAWSPADGDFDDQLRTAPGDATLLAIAVAIEDAQLVEAVDVGAHEPQVESTSRRQARPIDSSLDDAGAAPTDPRAEAATADECEPSQPVPPAPRAPPSSSRSDQSIAETLALDEEEDLKDALAACADLNENDTDNGIRLRRYFKRDLLVMAQTGKEIGAWLHWSGKHWDYDGGLAGTHILAQRVGDLIEREADSLAHTWWEKDAIASAQAAAVELDGLAKPSNGNGKRRKKDLDDTARKKELAAIVRKGANAQAALMARKIERRGFGNQTKNMARIKNMLDAALPHLRCAPDAFNVDPLLVATQTHTLRFLREIDQENPDPDGVRYRARVIADAEHRRSDMLTAVVPIAYVPGARGEKWEKFLARCLPNEGKRRTVQMFSGLGLTGLPIQRLMFHTGTGANGKSVFLEVLTRALGDSFAVGLPVESIVGMATGTGAQASPDIARLFGKRMLRVHELPAGSALRAEVIKKLTGGERMIARELHKGFFEFQPKAKPHMSGNDFPTFDGSDGGMKRRVIAIEWTEKIPESEQRDFEDFVNDLMTEGPAILQWLIDGVCDYLANGLVLDESTIEFTQNYFNDMDPVGQFAKACLADDPGHNEKARDVYNAYLAWSEANARVPMKETRFGRTLKKTHPRDDGRVHVYLNVRLHDVPIRPRDPKEDNPPSPTEYPEEIRI